MSWRKLVEINCDHRPRDAAAMQSFAEGLWDFLGSGDPRSLPVGVTFLQSRHHSESSPTGWMPPRDRAHGYRCLGHVDGEWRGVTWHSEPPHHVWAKPFWLIDGWKPTRSRTFPPEMFAPLPTIERPSQEQAS